MQMTASTASSRRTRSRIRGKEASKSRATGIQTSTGLSTASHGGNRSSMARTVSSESPASSRPAPSTASMARMAPPPEKLTTATRFPLGGV